MNLSHRHPLPAADNYTNANTEAEAIQKDLYELVASLDRASFTVGLRTNEYLTAKKAGNTYIAHRAKECRDDAQTDVKNIREEIDLILSHMGDKGGDA